MDTKTLLVKSITLLYMESERGDVTHNSADLIKEVLTTIKDPEVVVTGDFGQDVIASLKDLLWRMVTNPANHHYDFEDFDQSVKLVCGRMEEVYHAINKVTSKLADEEEEKKLRRMNNIRRDLRIYSNGCRATELVRKFYNESSFNRNNVDFPSAIAQLRADLEPLEQSSATSIFQHHAVNQVGSLTDVSATATILGMARDELSTEGVMRFGWQGLNRMFGSQGGGRRGEMIVVGALQHSYKSGFALDTQRQVAWYNKPYMFDSAKKPALVRFSFENSATYDYTWWLKSIFEQRQNLKFDPSGMSESDMAALLAKELGINGYEILYVNINPTEFTYRDMFQMTDTWEAQGYEIHGLWIDYLNMMNKEGCSQGPMGEETRDLFRRVRNHYQPRKTMVITPHQMSTDAKMLKRQGVTSDDFLRDVANRGYWDGSKRIDQEVDMEIYLDKAEVNGETFLAFQRGKHRKVSITEARDLHFVQKFEPIGGLRDDINGKDTSRRKVGGATLAEGGADPWYDGI